MYHRVSFHFKCSYVARLAFAKAFALNTFLLLFVAAFFWATVLKDLLSPLPASLRLAVLVTQDVLITAAIFVLIRSTIIPFFFFECRLRVFYGFRASEIVIRKPPACPSMLNRNVPEEQRMERSWRMATRAVNPELLYSNAGAMLSADYWTMEYVAVFDALRSIAAGEFAEEDLEFAVWKQDKGVWNVCELWRMHEIMSDQQEVTMFRTFLTQSGKQELLNIWQEMLSSSEIERSPSPKAYQVMANKFAREGLDYEAVWSHVTEKSPAVL